jgi:hypothetical protein
MKFLKRALIFVILTILTQVGGIIYILSILIYSRFRFSKLDRYKESIRRISFHVLVYLSFSFLIIPVIAKYFGRVPLPIFSQNNLGTRTIWTTILNRHYVRPALKDLALKVSTEMGEKYPGIKINYFDANHPFYKGYPLIPHLSHNYGKQLDLGFVYNDAQTGELSKNTPSKIGYGISEEPRKNEEDEPQKCSFKKTYNLMNMIYPKWSKSDYTFNEVITAELIRRYVTNKNVEKIFLEPHLKSRLKLHSGKIRPAGCNAVRHDDHFHVQIY